MCGFIATSNRDIPLDKVLDHIHYRGLPGYKGYAKMNGYQFGHYSLPFVNLDPDRSIQPRGDNDYMFVGEIFNYADFGYQDDIECARHVVPKSIKDLNRYQFDGFWSYIGLMDGNIVAGVDYLGQKPIYYRTDMTAFASEIDVLKLLGPTTRDKTFQSNTLKWGYSPDPRTPWNEIKQIPPGHVWRDRKVSNNWQWSEVKTTTLYDDLVRAVENRLSGQREVAVLVSGGLDSAIIYSIIKNVLGREVTAIHVDNGEEEYAKLVCDDLVKVTLDSVTDLEAMIVHQTPVDLGSVKPQIAMAKKLRQLGFYAVMTGDGADELFGGYRRAKQYDSQHSDVFCELPYYHLPRLDRTMMRYTIETRSPFLSAPIVKHALDTPYEQRIDKKILKETFGHLVPEAILTRDKHPLKTDAIRTDPMKQRLDNDALWMTMN